MKGWKVNRKKKIAAVAVMAGLFVVGAAGSAMSRTGNGALYVGNEYAAFDGSVYWYPKGSNYGGMRVYGNLKDLKADSNSVKVNGKVAGYSYTTLWTNSKGAGSSVYGDKGRL